MELKSKLGTIEPFIWNISLLESKLAIAKES